MKPLSKDKRKYILITGLELEELQKQTWQMAESFWLDRKIENYKWIRPIWLWNWDIEYLNDLIYVIFKQWEIYPDKNFSWYLAMKNLETRLHKLDKIVV